MAISVEIDLGELSGRALILSDWGCGPDKSACPDSGAGQRSVAAAMAQFAASSPMDFLVNAGDAFYQYGVADADDSQWVSTFEDVYNSPALQMPWYGVLGNHDWHRNHSALLQFGHRWRIPAPYYVAKGKIRSSGKEVMFYFLDTNVVMAEDICKFRNRSTWGPLNAAGFARCAQEVRNVFDSQLPWLEARLAETSPDALKVVVAHQPVVNSTGYWGTFGDDAPNLLQQRLLPVLQRYDVHVYIAGHDHFFQHLEIPGGAMDVFVMGSGGGELEDKPFDVSTVGIVRHTQPGAFGFGVLDFDVGSVCVRWIPAPHQGDVHEYQHCRNVAISTALLS